MVLGPIAIVFGLLVTLAGRKFFPVTIAFMGCAAGFGITMLLFQMNRMLNSHRNLHQDSLYSTIFSLLFSGLIGLFIGFILQRMLHIAAAIIGAIGGFFIGVALYNLVFFFEQSQLLLSSLSVLSALTMAFLSVRYYDIIVIVSTALVGAYSFIRGCSLFIGGLPSEYAMYTKFTEGDLQFRTEMYVYLAAFVVVFGVGVVYQRKQKEKSDKSNYIKI